MIKKELPVFLVIGLLTVLVDYCVYRGIIYLAWLSTDLAKGCSFLCGTLFAYYANRRWTFGGRPHTSGSMLRFGLLYALTLLINMGANALVLHALLPHSNALAIAFLIATGLSAALNFLGMKYLVFTHASTQSPR